MLTAALSLSAAFAYTVHDYLMMRVVRAVAILTALFWVQLVGLAFLLPLWFAFASRPQGADEWRAAGLAAVSGPIEIVALACLLKALAVGKLSIVAPLAALGGGFGALFAILLGEPVAGLAWIGLPLAVAGAVLASMERSEEHGGQVRATAGAGWAILCALIYAVEPVIIGKAALLGPVGVVTIGRVSSLLVLAPVTAVLGGFAVPRVFAPRIALAGIADAGAFLAFVAAAAVGPIATVSVLTAQTGAMSAGLGMLALRERPTRPQMAGIGATLVAVTLLALGGSG
jgi:drug/metabolite transporter (DMT)-like permease